MALLAKQGVSIARSSSERQDGTKELSTVRVRASIGSLKAPLERCLPPYRSVAPNAERLG